MPIEMNGVQAWITVGDKVQVAEYEVDLDLATNTATCWISGEPDQVCLLLCMCKSYPPLPSSLNSVPIKKDPRDLR